MSFGFALYLDAVSEVEAPESREGDQGRNDRGWSDCVVNLTLDMLLWRILRTDRWVYEDA